MSLFGVQSILAPGFADAAARHVTDGHPAVGTATDQQPTIAASLPTSPIDSVKAAGFTTLLNPVPTAPVDPGMAQGGFFGVLGTLMDQLDAMLGQLLGDSALPGNGNGNGNGEGTESPAPARRTI